MDTRQPNGSVGWRQIVVKSDVAEALSAQLLAVANDSATWSLANFGSMVIRVTSEDAGAKFFFSPTAGALFADVIATHGGVSSAPPLAQRLVPARTSRLMLGFRSHWEPFTPPRRIPVPAGIPQPPRDAKG